MFKKMRSTLIVMLTVFTFMAAATACYGNSAEPPSILIIVPNAPDDLEISISAGDTFIKANKTDKVIEKYYTFYSRDLRTTTDYTFKISTGGTSYNISIEEPLTKYNNIYTLNLKSQTLTPGKLLSRSILLVSMRIILTLIIEAIVFWLFGFRSKRSWIAFLVINLITQGTLNIFINGSSPLQGYIIFGLVFAEIFIIIFELIAFLAAIKEYRWRTVFHVIIANLLSLFAGGYIITVLPI